ncbi:MAG: PadR family transcriptional regulator [Chloroflexota bacterium]
MTDPDQLDKKFQKEITSGIASLALLKVMERSDEPMYGYQVAKLVGPDDGREPILKQGALYPVLRSLEKSGLLTSSVEPSVSGPPRRYYTITGDGRTTLLRWVSIWQDAKTFVDHILEGELL